MIIGSFDYLFDTEQEVRKMNCHTCRHYKHCMDRSRDLPCTNYMKQVQTARHTMSTRDKRGDDDGSSKRGCDTAVYGEGP